MLPSHGEAIDPIAMARRDMRKNLPRRFYQNAAVMPSDKGFALGLDGRIAHTPARHLLIVPHRALCEGVVREWQQQNDVIDPALMPITRMVNTVLDGVAENINEVSADIIKYAASDLICYRATSPQALVDAQNTLWDGVLAHFHARYGQGFVLAQGIGFVAQPPEVMACVADDVRALSDPFILAAVHVLTTLTGSALLALAHDQGALDPETMWACAHVDEDVQMRQWGHDSEALSRRAARFKEAMAAVEIIASCRDAVAG
jgi:chaperone required for assembly of F1-ATPase